ncbi:(2Fe-2S) ferredoxin domain-containing protein [Halanaerobium salsuginis]|jgi:NADH:ubiquinone oxidoreductase subunit E|uniref:Thioredoxin-like [2Fe-2S] ferredoxin n=1 Tax=Halanaerobium salsuginis TaxID=29563 RepID=A0A1I4HAH1_9FIRM|nr:(2Fe-2S) ferredoxin domain-containing protein [Halanaerobium salsuginis]SFL38607.1 Thioredoxin-like [2Fe-2S] ferredoxin [Halanaerobium salsuginis]
MQKVLICVGSSCHLKGAEKVVAIFKDLIEKYKLQNSIELSASFCQGNCTEGVNIAINGNKIAAVNEENAAAIFAAHLLPDQNE